MLLEMTYHCIDGGIGTGRRAPQELKRKLAEKSLLSDSEESSKIIIYNSINDNKIIDFCYNLIKV